MVGIAVPDERPLAGRLIGWMFIVGLILTTLLPLLPGANGEVLAPDLPLGVAAGLWGVYAVVRLDWRTAGGWVIHAAIVGGSVSAAIATSDTGGAASPARFLLMLAVVYTAYFFPAREAWPYLGLVLVLHAAPLGYDRHSGLDEVLGELMILAPCYWLLAYLLICGKRGMVAAQAQADRLARLDSLTGLANRRALLEAIEAQPGRRRAADARHRRLQAHEHAARSPRGRSRAAVRR